MKLKSYLTPDELQRTLSALPADVQGILKTYAGSIFLAGGFLRAIVAGETPTDIDLWGTDKPTILVAAADLGAFRSTLGGRSRTHKTDTADTVLMGGMIPVQFIHKWTFNTPHDCIDSFDFTIAQAALWWDASSCPPDGKPAGWSHVTAGSFRDDVKNKKLRYNAPMREEKPAGSLMRVLKFNRRGYSIDAKSLALVIARATDGLPSLDDHGFKSLKERITDARCHY